MNKAKLITGIIAAAAVGAAIGVAYAPDKGSRTRGKVKRQMDDLSENVKGLAEAAKSKTVDTATDLYDQGKKTVNKAVDKIAGNINSVTA